MRLEQGSRDWVRIGGGEVLRSCVGDLDVSLARASGNMDEPRHRARAGCQDFHLILNSAFSILTLLTQLPDTSKLPVTMLRRSQKANIRQAMVELCNRSYRLPSIATSSATNFKKLLKK